MQELLTTLQAAQFLGMSAAFLEKARWAGNPKIPYRKIGRSVRYEKDDLQEYVDSQKRVSTSE